MFNIAIDGHAGSGKSAIAKGLAQKLGFHLLNTGSIYRALACAYRDSNLGDLTEEKVDLFLENANLEIEFLEDGQHTYVNGIDYTPYLREEEISMLASSISAYPHLREKMLSIQRDFASKYNCILEGRDIGTVVLPNAQIKFFVTAASDVRAQRRLKQNGGGNYEEILKNIIARDYQDEHKPVSPLKITDDSILIDTSNDTVEQSVEKCLGYVEKVLNKN